MPCSPWFAPLLLAASAASTPVAAAPAEDPWFVHAGVARMSTDEAVAANVLGSPLPGAGIRVEPRYAATVEIGRYIAPTIAFSLSAGSPVRQLIGAAGSIRPFGTLGKVTYGPAAFTLHWHPLSQGFIRPYVGGGVAYLHVFDAKAGALAGFALHDDLGPVAQGGLELMANRHLGVFADAKKGWLTSSASGSLGGLPVNARLRLDPLILNAGATFRF